MSDYSFVRPPGAIWLTTAFAHTPHLAPHTTYTHKHSRLETNVTSIWHQLSRLALAAWVTQISPQQISPSLAHLAFQLPVPWVREPVPSIFIHEVGLSLSLSNATRVQAGRKQKQKPEHETRAKAKLIDFLLAATRQPRLNEFSVFFRPPAHSDNPIYICFDSQRRRTHLEATTVQLL